MDMLAGSPGWMDLAPNQWNTVLGPQFRRASADPPWSTGSCALGRVSAYHARKPGGKQIAVSLDPHPRGDCLSYGLGQQSVRLDTILASDMMQGPEKDSLVRAFRADRMLGQAKGLRVCKPTGGPIASDPLRTAA
jgi:hypothetical protein